MTFALRPVRLPDFEVPHARPEIPADIYALRADTAYRRAGKDWLVVYADREHLANMAFLTGFEPRFEEALLILGKGGRRILVTGNESGSYAVLAGLPDLEVVLCRSLSLLGQPRETAPNLEDVLGEIGLAHGDTIGLVGYLLRMVFSLRRVPFKSRKKLVCSEAVALYLQHSGVEVGRTRLVTPRDLFELAQKRPDVFELLETGKAFKKAQRRARGHSK